MPELPEVETVRREIDAALLGWIVRDVVIHREDVVEWPDDASSARTRMLLHGDVLHASHRRGKQMVIEGSSGRVIRIHLGMTGRCDIRPGHDSPHVVHDHITWHMQRGREKCTLVFHDARRFGSVRPFASMKDVERAWSDLGPDALTISGQELFEATAHSRRGIKCVLLDQAAIAGVGNIYADESLFCAGIHPEHPAMELNAHAVSRLARCIRDILSIAVEGKGSTIRDYRTSSGRSGSFQSKHSVYGRANEPCMRCGRTLKRLVVTQRTTVVCTRCQPAFRKG